MNESTIRTRRQIAELRLRCDASVGDLVRVYGGIGGDFAVKGSDVALSIAAADQRKTLAILIDSPGGIVSDARRVVDAIATRRGKTRTVAVSLAASAAALIFAAGDERWAYETTTFNIHWIERVDRKDIGRMTAQQLRGIASKIDEFDEWMVALLHQRTRHPVAALRQLLSQDIDISTKRARLIGLVTHTYPTVDATAAKIRQAAKRISRRAQAAAEPAPSSERPAPAARPSWFPESGRGPILGIDPRRLGGLIDTGRLRPDFAFRGPAR